MSQQKKKKKDAKTVNKSDFYNFFVSDTRFSFYAVAKFYMPMLTVMRDGLSNQQNLNKFIKKDILDV